MEGKLIKSEYHSYILEDNEGNLIGSISDNDSIYKLSIKNCESIANGYDLDELAEHFEKDNYNGDLEHHPIVIYKTAFQKALEILGDKKFSINEVVELCKILMSNPFEKCGKTYQELTDNYIQSLQQTEWDVEIVMDICGDKVYAVPEPALDENGCLILKRK